MNKKAAGYTFLGLTVLYLALLLLFSYTGIGAEFSTTSILIISEALIVIPAIAITIIYKREDSCIQLWGFKKISPLTVLLTPIFAALVMPMGILMNLITMQFVDNTFVSASDSILGLPYVVAILIMGIFGPLCEEIAFRGVIYNSLKKSGCGIAAIIVSSVMFGLMHMNLNQFAYATLLGIAFVIINEASGSIWTSIICHICYNSFNVSIMFLVNILMPDFYGSDASTQAVSSLNFPVAFFVYLVMAVGCGVIAIIVLGAVSKKEGRDNFFKEIKLRKENPLTVCSLIGILLSTVFIIIDTISIISSVQ